MQRIVSIGIGIFILPTLLMVLIPLMSNILNSEFVNNLSTISGYLNDFIGSNNVNYLLILISFLMFVIVLRWIIRFISNISSK